MSLEKKKSSEKYRSLSEQEKQKKAKHGRERHKIPLKVESKGWLSIENDTMKCGKMITD